MIRGLMLSAAILAAGTVSASAEVVFRGAIKILAVTPQCQNVQAGWTFTSSFHPFLTSQDDHSEGITFVYQFGGIGLTRQNAAFPSAANTFVAVETGGLGWGGVYTKPANERAQVGAFTHAAITTTTPFVIVTGKVKRFDEDPGGLACVITFRGTYFKDQ